MTSKLAGIVPDSGGDVVARWVFTTREGGVSRLPYDSRNLGSHVGDLADAVVQNRRGLASELGVSPEFMTFMHPDHGRGVAVVDQTSVTGIAAGVEIRDVDALVSNTPGVGLVALSADCVPCLFVDPQSRVVAAVHSGWRGLLVDVAGHAVGSMVDLGASPEQIQCWLGPAICGSCYPVPQSRANEVSEVSPEALTQSPDGQPALDLRRGIAASLARLGVSVSLVGGCTSHEPGYFSHRRDGRTGRQGGAIALLEPGAAS